MSTFPAPIDHAWIASMKRALPERVRQNLQTAIDRIVEAKGRGGQIAVVTGSGPNLHEGVTTLLAELIRVGVVDGVTTSSAVIAHEMAGTLDRVKRVDGRALGLPEADLPHGGHFELTVMNPEALQAAGREYPLDDDLIARLQQAPGDRIIKAAGNMAYPMGYRTEKLALEILPLARSENLPLEEIAGRGADPRTMLGAGQRRGVPVLVTIPQLVGGGGVGLAIGDSISITERSERVARLMGAADVIIESAVALTQEIHDGPYETYTGHGIWAGWDGHPTYCLRDKSLIRLDLDPNLEKVCQMERSSASVQQAIDRGLPKTKLLEVPFRMEMSGFARLPGSIPLVGDIGVLWPILASEVAERLDLKLQFISYPQQTEPGQAMREWIVDTVQPVDRANVLKV
jgi:hypothetical protein